MRGNFPHTCKHFNSPKNDIELALRYFHITGTFPMSLNCILKLLREAQGKFSRKKSPGIPQGKEVVISTSKIPLHFP